MTDPAKREETIFNAVLDLPAQLRADYLAKACAGDPDLLAEIRRLLEAIGQPVTPPLSE